MTISPASPTQGLGQSIDPPAGQSVGMTAVLRVHNEAHHLPFVLPGLLRTCDEVLLVDNASTDQTSQVAEDVATSLGLAGRLRVVSYPHVLSKCGEEHLHTPPDSVHSLAYFNNWAVSHVRTRYAVKWDGDMVLTSDGETALAAFAWQVGQREVKLRIPRHPVYLESDSVAYIDLHLRNVEHFGHPVAPGYRYAKAFEWEFLLFPPGVPNLDLPWGSCVELKDLSHDEFDHWTSTESFATSARTQRKRREYAVFTALRAGDLGSLRGVHRIEAPAGTHVVDHLAQHWLPAQRPEDSRD